MRKLVVGLSVGLLIGAPALAQQHPNPLFTPTEVNPFGGSFYTAPNTRTLPDGTEAPMPVPEAVLGPGEPLRKDCFWLSGDFLLGVGRGTRLPPLVTAGPAGGSGILGEPGTTTLFGGNRLTDFRPGMRIEGGVWLTERFALDGSFVYLAETSSRFSGSAAPGGPILAQPILFGPTGTETAIQVGTGTLDARASTGTIGGDANLRFCIRRSEYGRFDLLAGYRYLQLWDRVEVSSDRLAPAPADGPDVRVMTADTFRTRNEFHGPQFGFATSHRLFDRLTFSTRATVGLGVTLADGLVSGFTTTPAGTQNVGLLAGATNGGRHTNSYFAVLPSAEAVLGYDITDHVRINVGYSFLYWHRVERAADQIDRTLFSAGRPAYPNATTDYWMQGILMGLEVRY